MASLPEIDRRERESVRSMDTFSSFHRSVSSLPPSRQQQQHRGDNITLQQIVARPVAANEGTKEREGEHVYEEIQPPL